VQLIDTEKAPNSVHPGWQEGVYENAGEPDPRVNVVHPTVTTSGKLGEVRVKPAGVNPEEVEEADPVMVPVKSTVFCFPDVGSTSSSWTSKGQVMGSEVGEALVRVVFHTRRVFGPVLQVGRLPGGERSCVTKCRLLSPLALKHESPGGAGVTMVVE
jgi:hypothetical protein